MEYKIEIKETLAKTVTVEAESAIKALEIIKRDWKNCDHYLTSEHFQGVTFSSPKNRNYER